MFQTLSNAESLTLPLAVFQFVFSAVVSLTLWRLSAWQRQYEGLEGRLHDATTRLVDERFRSVTQEVDGHVRGMLVSLQEIKDRLHFNDSQLRALNDRDQKIELTLAGRIDMLKDYLREIGGNSRGEIERREASIERRLTQIEMRMREESRSTPAD